MQPKRMFEFDAFIKQAKKNSEPKQEKVYAMGYSVEEALREIEGFTENAVFTGKSSILSEDWQ